MARGGGGWQGRRRGEACFLLNAKREQEKVEWRGECIAVRTPFWNNTQPTVGKYSFIMRYLSR